MSPFIYNLCHKPIVGLAMATVALCEFPPLMKDVQMKLGEAGTVVTADVEVPVDLKYDLMLELSNPAGDSLSKQDVSIIGDRRVEDCGEGVDLAKVPKQERASFGRPMAFKVEVRHKPDNALVYSRTANTLCVASKWANQRSRSLGNFALARGAYSVRVENVDAQAGLGHLNTTVMLAPSRERPLTAQR
ncbi:MULTISPECIES: DUF5625 family protein [unclassified Duganella]|uniref:DUF5625 family protein n=1 Tax=unclassified Duganella TaxID=2636909 RepID=UPI0006FA13E2|nr:MULTISPECIES: DUF5625 family protein [unclassified Duganella]KQV56394.1 hypothetical protein ASD07_27155 [Duganella sp. Root336D2]KRB96464.1 hypothetical protein ASE26_25760 [Duganella sp. Root198D2]